MPSSSHLNPNLQIRAAGPPDPEELLEKLRSGDRFALARAITLLESARSADREVAQQVLNAALPHTGEALRIGITGSPGVGKSTFIENVGMRMIEQGRRVAVLAIDPSSRRTHGSILGDKTRMGELATHDDAFIRPSPTGGSLGGVARATREAAFLCEAAGYDRILIETVGVGQSEITVHSMVDLFLLLTLAGAGDELQGIKRGVVEMADLLCIHKADGANVEAAADARGAYTRALKLLRPVSEGWRVPVRTASSLTGDGLDQMLDDIERFVRHQRETGGFRARREEQATHWLRQTIDEALHRRFYEHPTVARRLPEIEEAVRKRELTSFAAAEELLHAYFDGGNDSRSAS